MRRLNVQQADFNQALDALLSWESVSNADVQQTVAQVIQDVKAEGDQALLRYTAKFDRLNVSSMQELTFERAALKAAFDRLPTQIQQALQYSADRVQSYHQQQVQKDWRYTDELGNVLGQKITPMDRAGLYVPAGTAPLASSVIMNAIPAKVAGVGELVMCSPTPDGQVSDALLGAAFVAGIDRVFALGGAQAIAALAYGTETIPAVDKITGPGNIYVATAKAQVFGKVGIDMIAGPSEILVICDGLTDPDWIAMDLFSQAEHDTDAQSILLCPDADYLDKVEEAIERLLPSQPRAEIIRQSLADRGALIQVADLAEAVAISNRIAPEHLELSVEDPEALLPEIRHAGAIFMGRYTAEALGDYVAGPNHVLPTSGTARFFSPLGVYDFQKRSSIIFCSAEGASELAKVTDVLAQVEQLPAHGRSAANRILKED